MSDNLIELLKIAADMPLSRIQDDEECADSLTVLYGRAAEALASLQQRNLLFMREREGARERGDNLEQRLWGALSLLKEAYDDVALIAENYELAAHIDALLAYGAQKEGMRDE